MNPFVATFIKSNSLAHICIFSQTIHTYDAITAPLYSVCLYKSLKISNNYVMSQRCLRSLTYRRLLVMEVVPCQKLIRRVPSAHRRRTYPAHSRAMPGIVGYGPGGPKGRRAHFRRLCLDLLRPYLPSTTVLPEAASSAPPLLPLS